MQKISQREVWIDNIKGFACILVVFGHFFQGMVKSGIMCSNEIYYWFEQTIYYFHVPLFFICSGYLYQKHSKVNTLNKWIYNIFKKAILLGIPYFTFTIITCISKNLFANSVNGDVGSMLNGLFISPIAPYWYLYCLFLIFLITPTFSNKWMAVLGVIISVVFKYLSILQICECFYAILIVMANEIWFVFGMCLSLINLDKYIGKKLFLVAGILVFLLFTFLSVGVYCGNWIINGISFYMGILACLSIFLIMIGIGDLQTIFGKIITKYNLPIFLMHTIFAAAMRILLIKLDISSEVVHVILGLGVSFLGPIGAMMFIERIKLDFLIYPEKYIMFKKKKE